ncbi:MAG: hypothetical protein LKF61_03065 [Eggerthellaceae bacterium]|nr:hypothetical protein [Eggerthellaceae bacterium]
MAKCWELRGCDEEMQSRCPHNKPGAPCPMDCRFADCNRPTHHQVDAYDALSYPTIDRSVCNKATCTLCEFFLTHGPEVANPVH